MRKPLNASTAKPVRLWVADAEWVRQVAFDRRVQQAVVIAEAIEAYRAQEAAQSAAGASG